MLHYFWFGKGDYRQVQEHGSIEIKITALRARGEIAEQYTQFKGKIAF